MEPIAIDEPLYMVNSDEIEVAMIAFDEATIPLPSFQFYFYNNSRAIRSV